jgi:hypothetical protein
MNLRDRADGLLEGSVSIASSRRCDCHRFLRFSLRKWRFKGAPLGCRYRIPFQRRLTGDGRLTPVQRDAHQSRSTLRNAFGDRPKRLEGPCEGCLARIARRMSDHINDGRRWSIGRAPTERSGVALAKPRLRTRDCEASIRCCANWDAAGEIGPVHTPQSHALSRSS